MSRKPETSHVGSHPNTRATIYLVPAFHRALRLKAAHTQRTMPDLVVDVVRQALCEDQEHLAAFEQRIAEPEISYEALLRDNKAHGKL